MQPTSNVIAKQIHLGVNLPGHERPARSRGLVVGLGVAAAAVLLTAGVVTGWVLGAAGFRLSLETPAVAQEQADSARNAFVGALQREVADRQDHAHRLRVAKLDVSSFEAQLDQAKGSVSTATSAHAALKVETEATIAAAGAKLDMARKTLDRLAELRRNNACGQDELDAAQMAVAVAQADLKAAQSKLLCVETLRATIAQRQADVRTAHAKLQVAQADLEEVQRQADEIVVAGR